MLDVHIDTAAANYIIGENKHTCWVYRCSRFFPEKKKRFSIYQESDVFPVTFLLTQTNLLQSIIFRLFTMH